MTQRKRKTPMVLAAAAAAGGAAAAYLLDPDRGRSRRVEMKDRLLGKVRRPAKKLGAEASKKTQLAQDRARGKAREVTRSARDLMPETDEELVDKVRSEVLGREQWRGHTVNVDAVDGVVTLHGQLEGPRRDELVAQVRTVPGVRDVDSYLHEPGTPPPNKEEALQASRTQRDRPGR